MIVGTAGHVDHGKTALVRALTGTETDRLATEKARGISIELGFAYRRRAMGDMLGFVDVPGHERFMRAMVAGASGIDLLLLCVAADGGIMPQTREHLAVADLLGISKCVVAVTRCDLVDAERIDALEAEIRELLAPTGLAGARLVPTSAKSGQGIDDLWATLEGLATPAAADDAPLRFAIDRSFSLTGSGTVVTGVIVAGTVGVGDTVTISPSGKPARVRALHVQSQPAEAGFRGQRCGVNLGGVDVRSVSRGDWLVAPPLHAPSARIDAEIRVLADVARPLRHWQPIRLHHGASEVSGRVALLRDDPIGADESGLIQLVLDEPLAAACGDRFVVRDHTGSWTLGGGRLIDLRAPQRRRKQARRLEQLQAMAIADPGQSLAAQLAIWPWYVSQERFEADRALGPAEAARVLDSVAHHAAPGPDGSTYLFGECVWKRLRCSTRGEVALFHQRYPQFLGPNVQRLRLALGPRLPPVPTLAALGLMVKQGVLAHESGVYRLPEHQLGLDREDEMLWGRIAPHLGGANRFRPPRVTQLAEDLLIRDFDCRRVMKAKAKQGAVVEISPEHFFLRKTLDEIADIVAELSETSEGGEFGAAQLRDRLNNGRRVAIELLEWFDRQGLTLRKGDVRTIDPRKLERFHSKETA